MKDYKGFDPDDKVQGLTAADSSMAHAAHIAAAMDRILQSVITARGDHK